MLGHREPGYGTRISTPRCAPGDACSTMLRKLHETLAALGKVPWLDLLYALSYVKLAITLCKYVPQVWLNMRRHSTAGWNIDNVVLDFTGGVLTYLRAYLRTDLLIT